MQRPEAFAPEPDRHLDRRFRMFATISRSFSLAKSSWEVLRANKQLTLFPVVSGLACLAIFISFLVPLGILALVAPQAYEKDNNPWIWELPVAFAYYFATSFVVVFCNSALVSCALMHFRGETPTLGAGFRAAWARLPQIAAWSLVAATVTLILRIIENIKVKIAGVDVNVGAIIASILGFAWGVMTFFVVPVLVVEKVGPIDAIKGSIRTLRKTWGEALVGNIGLGLFQLLLFLPGIFVVIVAIIVLVAVPALWPVGVALLIFGILLLLAAAAIASALNTVFVTALYNYAAFDQVPAGFDEDTMANAFTSSKKVA
jgi:hypothetical protein